MEPINLFNFKGDKMKKTKVLHIFSSLDRGGAETMVMNLYRNINNEQFHFDFVVNDSIEKYAYEDEINKIGGSIYHIPKYKFYNHFKFKKIWKEILDKSQPDIIHAHSLFPAWIYMKAAKKCGIKIISHIHNQKGLYNSFKEQLFTYNKIKFYKYVDTPLSCSVEASKYAYGKNEDKAIIFNNSLEVNDFVFNQLNRTIIRTEFNISDETILLGHVGRFVDVKNHRFLISLLENLITIKSNIKLMLVGDGELRDEIEKLVVEKGLENHVIFTGVRGDINKIMSAFDMFLFPSKTEGFPMVLLEAQISGLKIISTVNVDLNVNLSNTINFIAIEDKNSWTSKILEIDNNNRKVDLNKFKDYDSNLNVLKLEGIYINLTRGK